MPTAEHGACESRPAIGAVMGVQHAVQARPVGLNAGLPRPSRRSDDLLLPVLLDPKCLAGQALPLTPRKFEPLPLSAPPDDVCR
jgi:hypothetical protein